MDIKLDSYKIFEKVRILVVKMPWKKILTFSFFLLLSAIFWFMQIYRQNFNATYNIPIKYSSVPDSIVFNQQLPQEVSVTVNDNGFALFKYYFTKSNDSLDINVADIIQYSSSRVIQGLTFQQLIRNHLLNTSDILEFNPAGISFEYTTLEEKKVPIIFDGQIFLAAGYLLSGDIQIIPDSIMVYGSKELLNTISYVYTESDTILDFKSKNPLVYKIENIDNAKLSTNSIKVIIPVDKYTQKDIIVPIQCINTPENIEVKFFPSTVKISFLVGLSEYHSITDRDFSVELDYNDLKEIHDLSIPLRITSSPDHIKNLILSPSEVEFIFEQQ